MSNTTAPTIEFVDLPEDVNANEYDPIVEALIEAGPGKGYPLVIEGLANVQKHVRRFSEAARRHDRTAKQVTRTIDGDTTTVLFKLTEKIVRKNSQDGGESATVGTEATE